MSVISDVVGKVLGGGQQTALSQQIVALLENKEGGGLAGLVAQFKAKGFDQIVQSWVSKNKNLPITGQQLQSVLGDQRVQQIAAKLGINVEQASAQLAKLLPEAVDQATPDGELPAQIDPGDFVEKVKV
jgi:uncharacterized protein YidB (DUF937 family)